MPSTIIVEGAARMFVIYRAKMCWLSALRSVNIANKYKGSDLAFVIYCSHFCCKIAFLHFVLWWS